MYFVLPFFIFVSAILFVYQTKSVFEVSVELYAIVMTLVARVIYVRTGYVSKGVEMTTHVMKIKPASTASVKVSFDQTYFSYH